MCWRDCTGFKAITFHASYGVWSPIRHGSPSAIRKNPEHKARCIHPSSTDWHGMPLSPDGLVSSAFIEVKHLSETIHRAEALLTVKSFWCLRNPDGNLNIKG